MPIMNCLISLYAIMKGPRLPYNEGFHHNWKEWIEAPTPGKCYLFLDFLLYRYMGYPHPNSNNQLMLQIKIHLRLLVMLSR
jgi:hypothetical protein